MITRFQTQDIVRLMKGFPAVGIIGPRQVGKTTLTKTLSAELNTEVQYLDLENFKDIDRLGQDPFIFFEAFSNHCIILDEIQRKPELFPMLRSEIDRDRRPGRFILLGSASPVMLAKSSESLAGRIAYHELFPITFPEAQPYEISIATHWFRGGFPFPLTINDEQLWSNWHRSFVRSFIEIDLQSLGVKVQPALISRLLYVLASIHGQNLNVESISRTMGLRNGIVKDYLDILEQSFIIRRLAPYHSNLGKRIIKSPKLYIRDSGILHNLLNLTNPNQVHLNIAKGASWEGYVIEQIVNQLHSNVRPYFYLTAHQAEIDLVLEVANQVVACFEIKLSDSPALTKGNHFAVEDMRCENNFVLTYSAGDYKLNTKWQVTDLHHVGQHLDRLGLRASYFVGK